MPKARSPNRDKAKEMYLDSGKTLLCKDIAKTLSISESQIRNWKAQDTWDSENKIAQSNTNRCATKRKKGGQPNNKNATGPPGNKNAETHGFFSKYLPAETFAIIQEIEKKSPLDILWENINIQYAAIVRAQNIMYVKDREDKTTTKIGESNGDTSTSEKWEVQQAWDKQATFLQAQSRAMKTLEGLIKQYDDMVNKSALATEEQKLRIDKLRAEIDKITGVDGPDEPVDDGFLDALNGTAAADWSDHED